VLPGYNWTIIVEKNASFVTFFLPVMSCSQTTIHSIPTAQSIPSLPCSATTFDCSLVRSPSRLHKVLFRECCVNNCKTPFIYFLMKPTIRPTAIEVHILRPVVGFLGESCGVVRLALPNCHHHTVFQNRSTGTLVPKRWAVKSRHAVRLPAVALPIACHKMTCGLSHAQLWLKSWSSVCEGPSLERELASIIRGCKSPSQSSCRSAILRPQSSWPPASTVRPPHRADRTPTCRAGWGISPSGPSGSVRCLERRIPDRVIRGPDMQEYLISEVGWRC
jgi:hypothetical protein